MEASLISDTDFIADSLSNSFHSDITVLFIFNTDRLAKMDEFSSTVPTINKRIVMQYTTTNFMSCYINAYNK